MSWITVVIQQYFMKALKSKTREAFVRRMEGADSSSSQGSTVEVGGIYLDFCEKHGLAPRDSGSLELFLKKFAEKGTQALLGRLRLPKLLPVCCQRVRPQRKQANNDRQDRWRG